MSNYVDRFAHPLLLQFQTSFFGQTRAFSEDPPENLNFTDAVVMAYMDQPRDWNPRSPRTNIAQHLLTEVRSGIPDVHHPERVCLYLAHGTSLQWWYNVSAFFLLDYDPWRLGLVTIDLALTDVQRGSPYCRHVVYLPTDSDERHTYLRGQICARIVRKQRGLLRAFQHYGIDPTQPG